MPTPHYTAAPLRTSRELADRAETEFQKRPDRFRRRIVWWSFWACVGAVVWLVAAAGREGRTIYEAGPVATSHRFFENDCAACHTTWAPVARLTNLTGEAAKVQSVDDALCQKCHVGSPHFTGQSPPHDGLGCAACHREHRHDSSLLAGSNSHCIECHSSLGDQLARLPKASASAAAKLPTVTITNFSSDHPDFDALVQRDSTPLAFNHKVHLQHEYDKDGKLVKGIINERGELEDLSKNCAACHQPDSAKLYMAPIRYAQHCQRCHPLNFDNKNFPGEVVPHGMPAATLRGYLTERYTGLAHQGALKSDAAEPVRPLPGRFRREPALSEEGRRRASEEAASADRRLTAPIARTEDAAREAALRREHVLFGPEALGGCRLCHTVSEQEADADQRGFQPEWTVEPPHIPDRWMSRSRFSHDSHRFIQSCTECHQDWSYDPPRDAALSEATSDVLMPPIAVCRSCHAETATIVLHEGVSESGPGVASKCIDCHDYHLRDQDPMSGSVHLDLSDRRAPAKDGS